MAKNPSNQRKTPKSGEPKRAAVYVNELLPIEERQQELVNILRNVVKNLEHYDGIIVYGSPATDVNEHVKDATPKRPFTAASNQPRQPDEKPHRNIKSNHRSRRPAGTVVRGNRRHGRHRLNLPGGKSWQKTRVTNGRPPRVENPSEPPST